MEKEVLDFIIVGQGIAGTALSWELHKLGARVLVYNQENPQTSSKIAAGLYNPITGRNMVKTWKADDLFPAIAPFYSELENVLQVKCLYPTGIYRPFFTHEECNDWQSKASSPEYAPYVSEVLPKSISEAGIKDPLGGLMLKNAGYVNLVTLLDSYKNWLLTRGMYVDGLFNFDNLLSTDDGLTYDRYSVSKVLFCTGISRAKLFNWLPFTPMRGELMDMRSDAEFEFILNRGVFMVPLKNGLVRVGSTYKRSNEQIFDNEAEKELNEKLSVIYSGSNSVKERKVGIRPATKDRKPFIGLHPDHSHFGVFNGFGSKGVSMVPYFAKQFARHLILGDSIDSEVDIQRYYSLS